MQIELKNLGDANNFKNKFILKLESIGFSRDSYNFPGH